MPEVRLARSEDLAAVGSTLAAAFADDPIWRWLAPTADWTPRAERWFTTEATVQFHGHGELWVDDALRGAAIWSPPNRWRPGVAETVRIAGPSLRLFGVGRTVTAMRFFTAMERVHPRTPEHWYLAILGTHPDHQGNGIGSALIRAVTQRCDEEGLDAYLESSKEANLAFYARHGFEAREPVRTKGSPPIWPMWRDARPPETP